MTDQPPTARDADQPPLVIFAGGGSGGHLFPALAVAERVRERVPDADLVFLCSQRRIDESILSQASEAFVPLGAQPLAWRPFPAALWRFAAGWRRAVARTRAVLAERRAASRPAIVALMGGFVAAPAARAARSAGLPVVLVNLDVVPGKANRLAARFASRLVSAVPCPDFPSFSREVVGMPIRRRAIAAAAPEECRRRLGLAPDHLTLLVTGASQGAGTLNRLVTDLIREHPAAFSGWQILHLTGEADFEEVRQGYAGGAVPAVVLPFLSEMALAWGAADLALSRCGASSVAEAVANRVPTLFSPYPWHRDEHQRLNAQPWVDAGLAWLEADRIDPQENLDLMGLRLLEVMADAPARARVRAGLADRPAADAAGAIADLLLSSAERPRVGRPQGGTDRFALARPG